MFAHAFHRSLCDPSLSRSLGTGRHLSGFRASLALPRFRRARRTRAWRSKLCRLPGQLESMARRHGPKDGSWRLRSLRRCPGWNAGADRGPRARAGPRSIDHPAGSDPLSGSRGRADILVETSVGIHRGTPSLVGTLPNDHPPQLTLSAQRPRDPQVFAIVSFEAERPTRPAEECSLDVLDPCSEKVAVCVAQRTGRRRLRVPSRRSEHCTFSVFQP